MSDQDRRNELRAAVQRGYGTDHQAELLRRPLPPLCDHGRLPATCWECKATVEVVSSCEVCGGPMVLDNNDEAHHLLPDSEQVDTAADADHDPE
jgi:hypothetical protein